MAKIAAVGVMVFGIGTFALISPQYALKCHMTVRETAEAEIQLDLQPFTDPIATFALLHERGTIEVVRYNRYQLIVVGVNKDQLPSATVERLITQMRDRAFREAFAHKDYSGEGLSRGDQFHLSLKSTVDKTEEIFGFLPDTPVVVRALIDELITLTKSAQKTSIAESYVRSLPIEKERFETLRREGKLRFVSIRELPSELQPPVNNAIKQPEKFIELNKKQYAELLALTSHGNDFFVAVNSSGHQLTLFQSAK